MCHTTIYTAWTIFEHSSIWLAAAGLETLIRSQPVLAEECSQSLAELRQKLGELIN